MDDDRLLSLLSEQSKSIEKQMEQGFKLIAAEMKAAVADRDAKLIEKISEANLMVAKVNDAITKHSNEIRILFSKSDEHAIAITKVLTNCEARTHVYHDINTRVSQLSSDVTIIREKAGAVDGTLKTKTIYLGVIVSILVAIISAWFSKASGK